MAIARSFRLYLLTISLAFGCLSCGVCAPRPFITSISPNSAIAGGNQFVLTVNGNDFRCDSLVSSHQLGAAITAADIAQPGMVLVFVFNPPETNTPSFSGAIGVGTITRCSGKDSNAVSFTVGG